MLPYGKVWSSARPGAGGQLVGAGLWLQLLEESLLKAEGQQPAKLLIGHDGSAGDVVDGKRGYGHH